MTKAILAERDSTIDILRDTMKISMRWTPITSGKFFFCETTTKKMLRFIHSDLLVTKWNDSHDRIGSI